MFYLVFGLKTQKSTLLPLFMCLCVYMPVVYWDYVVCASLCWDSGCKPVYVLCNFRQRQMRSAVWAMCTRLSVTTPMLWQVINSVCCWRDKPSASSPRLANWATWALCTQHWETSLMLFSATSSTWTSQRYSTNCTNYTSDSFLKVTGKSGSVNKCDIVSFGLVTGFDDSS